MSLKNQIINLREQGIGYKRIGKILNIPTTKVSEILIENGFISHVTIPDKKIVDEIVKKYTVEHLGTVAIAKKFGMTPYRVSSILKIEKVSLTPKSYHSNYDAKVKHDYFKKIDDEHKAYWLGFLYADGYNNEKNSQIEISLKKSDAYLLENFKDDTKSVYSIKNRIVTLNNKKFPQCRMIIYSKQMSQDLAMLGCIQRKSLILKFPATKIVPREFIHHFMRGYFDGDGCISGVKFMLNGTKNFLLDFVKILRYNAGISEAETWEMDGKAFRWAHSSKKDIVKIYDFLYKDATIFLKRKCERFLKIKQMPPRVGNNMSKIP